MGLCAVSTFWQLSVVLLKTCVHMFVWVPVFSSLGYIPRSWIAKSYGNSIFNFLRNGQTALHKAEPFYTPTSNEQRVPTSLVIFHYLLFSIKFIVIVVVVAFLVGIKVLFCISLLIGDVEHPALADHLYIFGGMSIRVLCPFLIRLSFSCWVISVLYIFALYQTPVRYMICKYFLPFCRLSFHFLIMSFNAHASACSVAQSCPTLLQPCGL